MKQIHKGTGVCEHCGSETLMLRHGFRRFCSDLCRQKTYPDYRKLNDVCHACGSLAVITWNEKYHGYIANCNNKICGGQWRAS